MEIPLFPLPNLVLFPQVAVPLHIFEERYKLMINRCIDQADVFGLVLLNEERGKENEDSISSRRRHRSSRPGGQAGRRPTQYPVRRRIPFSYRGVYRQRTLLDCRRGIFRR